MKMIINKRLIDKNPKQINPLHEMVNRMPLEIFRYVPTPQKIIWVNEMLKLYNECGIVNETLKRTVGYLKFLKNTKTTKEFYFEVEKIFWDYLLKEEGLNAHMEG